MSMVCLFRQGYADPISDQSLLGQKGGRLATMARLGLPIPPGLTITTAACEAFLASGDWPDGLFEAITQGLQELSTWSQRRFGDPNNPLLLGVSVSAPAPIPGLMDSVLNLGMNDASLEALGSWANSRSFAVTCYRNWIEHYGAVVARIDGHRFEEQRLHLSDLQDQLDAFKDVYLKACGQDFPQDPWHQLRSTLSVAFNSWRHPRAQRFRAAQHLRQDRGLAVHLTAMVFGNLSPRSGAGLCSTRHPQSGQHLLTGEYLPQGLGDELMAGLRAPQPLAQLARDLPDAFRSLEDCCSQLEHHHRDAQEIKFAIQDGRLYVLDSKPSHRSTEAAVRIAVDLTRESVITPAEALLRIRPTDTERLLHPSLDPRLHRQVIAKGLPSSPGAAAGRVVFCSRDTELWVNRGESVILVREETTPEDISSMHLARGFLTLRGGMTSHAAVVARQMAKPCITGCGSARLAASKKAMEVGTHTIREGDWITLDGSTGEVILGKVTTSETIVSDELRQLIEWSIKYQTTHVRANADTPADAQTAKIFGAQGIGLCRTEHMFFDPHRLPLVRQMILARSENERNKVLEELLPHQRTDFTNILCVMSGLPVTIRLLDPPLHEFLPHHNEDLAPLALEIGISELELRDRIRSLSEQNPMLGHRGCRLGISHPAIYEMQVLAICHATAEARALGQDPRPEIMIPLVGLAHELSWLRQRLERLCRTTLDDLGCHDITVPFGTMIEVPRAALTADELACHADFFSFGTNDLTQTTFGFSRDDSFGFLRTYEREGIVKSDPFVTLDTLGVGVLMELAMTKGRATNPSLKFGICGEHAGDPESLSYLNSLGLDYVSCSPFRVPLAQLAMAQAALRLVAGALLSNRLAIY